MAARAGIEPDGKDGLNDWNSATKENGKGPLTNRLTNGPVSGAELFGDLAELLDAWPSLSADVKRSVMAVIRVARADREPRRAEQESVSHDSLAPARENAAGLALGPAKDLTRPSGEESIQ